MPKLYLFSRRHSVALGWHWVNEREVTRETGAHWFAVYQDDETEVLFSIGPRPPKD